MLGCMVQVFITSWAQPLTSLSTAALRALIICNILSFILLACPSGCCYTFYQFLLNGDIQLHCSIVCCLFLGLAGGALTISILIGLLQQLQSQDIIISFVCLELINLSLYLLICTYSSGIKYILCSQVLTTFFIQAIALVQLEAGDTADINVQSPPLLIVFQLKLGIFPFHQLTADLYDGISTSIMMIIQLPIKLGIFLFQTRMEVGEGPQPGFALASFQLGIIISAIGASNSYTFKRFQSLSSTSYQTVQQAAQQQGGISSSITNYAIIYIITLSLITPNNKNAILVTILFQSIAGIPPLQGFYLKLSLINDMLQLGNSTWLLFLFLSSSLIQTANYIERSYIRGAGRKRTTIQVTLPSSLIISGIC